MSIFSIKFGKDFVYSKDISKTLQNKSVPNFNKRNSLLFNRPDILETGIFLWTGLNNCWEHYQDWILWNQVTDGSNFL